MEAQSRSARFDRSLAALADAQHGVVARRQLVALGLGRTAVANRMHRGTLVRMHRGVYAVGHRRLHRNGCWMAAVLAAGPGAVLSHRDAAALHDLRRPGDGRVDVTTTGDARGVRGGYRVHGTAWLAEEDVTSVVGIPVTSVARTLVDLAGVVGRQQLASAMSEAERHGVLDVAAIERAMARTVGRRGRGHERLRAVLAQHAAYGAQVTKSELELMLLSLLTAAGLPGPRTNAWVEGVEVDAYWPSRRLIVELDGWQFHRTRADFERDREKRTGLEAIGYRVVEFTHNQLTRRRTWVHTQLRLLLA